MTRPGTRLRSLAARVCSEKTMERLIDPVIGDLHLEYASATNLPQRSLALFQGYLAFAKVMLLCAVLGAREAWGNRDVDDWRNLHRVFWWSAGITLAWAFLVEMPGIWRLPEGIEISMARTLLLIVYLTPAALAPSVPIGLIAGIVLGLGGRQLRLRVIAAIGFIAFLSSTVSLVNVAWVTPMANQSYREEVFGGPVRRGPNELTLTELREFAQGASFYHTRLAIAVGPLTLALFGIITASRRWRPAFTVFIASIGIVSYVAGTQLGRSLSEQGLMPPQFAAWMPHGFLAYATILIGRSAARHNASTTRTRA